jgi:RNA polymerase sigma-70 factor (ECF subfamily)
MRYEAAAASGAGSRTAWTGEAMIYDTRGARAAGFSECREKERVMDERLSWDDVTSLMEEVKAMARGLLRQEHRVESFQTTALVLTALRRQRHPDQDWQTVTWQNRSYFFGAMYQAMRRALLDHGRKLAAHKRRAEILVRPEDLQLLNLPQTLEETPEQVVALCEALEWLLQREPQWVTALEHRFYGGLTLEETARVMGVSSKTIQRWWQRTQLVLAREILLSLNANEDRV